MVRPSFYTVVHGGNRINEEMVFSMVGETEASFGMFNRLSTLNGMLSDDHAEWIANYEGNLAGWIVPVISLYGGRGPLTVVVPPLAVRPAAGLLPVRGLWGGAGGLMDVDLVYLPFPEGVLGNVHGPVCFPVPVCPVG